MTTSSGKQIQFPPRRLFSSLWNRQEHLFLTVIGLSSVVTLFLFIGYSEILFQPTRQLAERKRNKDASADTTRLKGNSIFMKPTVTKSFLPVVSLHSSSNPYSERTKSRIHSRRNTRLNISSIYEQISLRENNFSGRRNVDLEQHFSERGKLCSYPRYCSENGTESMKLQSLKCFNGTHAFSFAPRMRLVHFDLKGAPPKVDFIVKILPLLKESGATGILIEYEDMFPYWGDLAPVAALNAYSVRDVKKILSTAKLLDLEVIPLVQTFGHLEYVLKLPQFIHLREVNDSASALCPLNKESFPLIATMIDQVLSLHPDAKWLHIGCDEVFRLALCSKCNKYQYMKDVLFLQHVTKVARYTRKKYNITPIIWDDMIRRISSHILQNANIGSLVEPMVWVYGESVENYFFPKMWQRYRFIFSNLWTASAFKGAFGRTILVPNAKRHLNNHISWLSSMARHKTINFQGIALTGWQRYEHFAPLCELFPVGLPSLVLNLLTVSEGCLTKGVFQAFLKLLGCKKNYNDFISDPYSILEQDPFLQHSLKECAFIGSDVFFAVQRTLNFNDTFYALLKRVCQYQLAEHANSRNVNKFKGKSEDLKNMMLKTISWQTLVARNRHILAEIYDEFSISEWIEQNLNPVKLKLEELLSSDQNNSLCNLNNGKQFIRKFPMHFLQPV